MSANGHGALAEQCRREVEARAKATCHQARWKQTVTGSTRTTREIEPARGKEKGRRLTGLCLIVNTSRLDTTHFCVWRRREAGKIKKEIVRVAEKRDSGVETGKEDSNHLFARKSVKFVLTHALCQRVLHCRPPGPLPSVAPMSISVRVLRKKEQLLSDGDHVLCKHAGI